MCSSSIALAVTVVVSFSFFFQCHSLLCLFHVHYTHAHRLTHTALAEAVRSLDDYRLHLAASFGLNKKEAEEARI